MPNVKKGRVVILVRDTSSGPVLYFCLVPLKYSKEYSSNRADTKSFSYKTKCDNSKSKKGRVFILVRDTSSGLFYISTKYHPNIPKGIQVTERARSLTPTPTPTLTLTPTPTPTGSVSVCPSPLW